MHGPLSEPQIRIKWLTDFRAVQQVFPTRGVSRLARFRANLLKPVPETLSPLSSKESRLPAATKAAHTGAAATDAAVTQVTESVAAAFPEPRRWPVT